MGISIQQIFCKFVANIFQNGTPELRTIVLTALKNPLSVFFVAIKIPSLVTVIWIVWKSGPTWEKTGSPHCLGIWYAMLMPCGNYWACVMVYIYLFYPLMKREILLTIFVWIAILRLFIMYHPLDIFTCPYLLLFIVIACVFICLFTLTHMWFISMCFTVSYLLVNYMRLKKVYIIWKLWN